MIKRRHYQKRISDFIFNVPWKGKRKRRSTKMSTENDVRLKQVGLLVNENTQQAFGLFKTGATLKDTEYTEGRNGMCQDDLCCGAISVLGGLLDGPGILVVVGSNGGHCGRRGDGDTRQSLLALVVRGGVSSLNSMPVLQQNAIIRPSERRQCERERGWESSRPLRQHKRESFWPFFFFFFFLLLPHTLTPLTV